MCVWGAKSCKQEQNLFWWIFVKTLWVIPLIHLNLSLTSSKYVNYRPTALPLLAVCLSLFSHSTFLIYHKMPINIHHYVYIIARFTRFLLIFQKKSKSNNKSHPCGVSGWVRDFVRRQEEKRINAHKINLFLVPSSCFKSKGISRRMWKRCRERSGFFFFLCVFFSILSEEFIWLKREKNSFTLWWMMSYDMKNDWKWLQSIFSLSIFAN